jgi:hypothetical protein
MNQRNTAASVRARLLTRARETRQDFNLVLNRYALERLLYRLSISPHVDQFLLKGALLFDLWFDIPHRPTRDADFLGFGSAELPHLEAVFKDVCAMETDDGVTFRPDTVHAAEIRKEANYAGVRITFGLTDGFAQDAQKQTQWQAFLGKNRLEALRLEDVVASLRDFLLPIIAAANADADYSQHWPAGGLWSSVA